MADDLGDRMKLYESAEAGRNLMPLLPIMARLDGRGFSGFTSGLAKPYDARLSNLMIDCLKYLVKETNANCGYTQSDEITLTWYSPDFIKQTFFNGRVSKLTSILAAMQSVYFNSKLNCIPERVDCMPLFDCRVWNVPTLEEGANVFLWREQDAIKNSISMAARAYFSHNELLNKNGPHMKSMLLEKGVNWDDYPAFFKRGTYVQRQKVYRPFTPEEIDKLPPKHAARTSEVTVERTEYVALDMPPFGSILNRAEVIYSGAEPRYKD